MPLNSRDRVKQMRARRKLEGLRRVEYWLDESGKMDMDALFRHVDDSRRFSPQPASDSPKSDRETTQSTE